MILQVGQAIGALNRIGVLIAVSVVGAWLVKREGRGVVRRRGSGWTGAPCPTASWWTAY